MKKIISFIIIVALSLALIGCRDKKVSVDERSVVFYTGNQKHGAPLVPSQFNLEEGDLVEKPEDPVWPGKSFGGWFSDSARQTPWNFETDKIGKTPLVLFAKWTDGVYTITYVLNGGTNHPNNVTEYHMGENVVFNIATRRGYNFRGWFDYEWVDESSTKPGDKSWVTIPLDYYGDLTLHAHWEFIVITVSFVVNYPEATGGPERPARVTIGYGDIIDFVQFQDTENYIFKGWNSNKSGTGVWYRNGEEFTRTSSVTLYAIWEAK